MGRLPLSIALVCGAVLSGCSPTFWRRQADVDTYEVISRTIDEPALAVPRVDITPDAQSRFAYAPSAQDCLPLPPDDPNAHQYMHCVDGWSGSDWWHENGQDFVIENPQWHAGLGLDPGAYDADTGTYQGGGVLPKLTVAEAVNVALLHNRQYQTQIESVYLEALLTTFEQFQFSVRFLDEPFVGANTNLLPGSARTDFQTLNTSAGLQRLLPTGGQLAAELANSTLWLFSGGSQTSTASAFSFALTQPLLANAGRKVVLEGLTQQQRDVLYAVRDLARFRKEFFVNIMAGSNGYLGLLLQTQLIRNDLDNIGRLKRQLEVLKADESRRPGRVPARVPVLPEGLYIDEALVLPAALEGKLRYDPRSREVIFDGDQITDEEADALRGLSDEPSFRVAVEEIVQQLTSEAATLDVLQLESTLANSVNRLRSRQASLQNQLDNYKQFLGLPTDFPLNVDDRLLEPFDFIDDGIEALDTEIEAYVSAWAAIGEEDPDAAAAAEFRDGLERLIDRIVEDGLSVVRADVRRLGSVDTGRLTPEQRRRFEADADRDRRILRSLVDRLRARRDGLGQLSDALAASEALSLAAGSASDPAAAASLRLQARSGLREVRILLNELRFSLLQDAQALAAIQVGVRADLLTLVPVDYTVEEVVRVALENRLDLRNERAFVTDAWRQVEIAKQQLKGNLNVVADADFATPSGTRPLDFESDLTRYRFGLNLTTPLDQIQERTVYRSSQIAYQRSRRSYIAAEDAVKADVRRAWRQLNLLRENFETTKLATRIAARQYDQAVEEANAPQTGGGGGRNVGLQLQRALGDVLDSQNDLVRIFLDYEESRLQLYRDMGTMEVLENGVWNDPFYLRIASGGGLFEDPGDLGGDAEGLGAEPEGDGGVEPDGGEERGTDELAAPPPLVEPDADSLPAAGNVPDEPLPDPPPAPPQLTPPPIGRPDVDQRPRTPFQ